MTGRLLGWVRQRTVRRQLIACITGVHMVLMIAFVSDLIERQRTFLVERARDRSVHQAEMLAASAVPQLITRDYAGLQEVIEAMSRDQSILYAVVTDSRGLIVGHSDQSRIGRHLTDSTAREVLGSTKPPHVFAEARQSLHSAAPIVANDRRIGWAWVAGDMSQDGVQIADVRKTGVAYVIIAIASGLIFSIVLANAITRQLRLLLAGTRRLAANNLSTPVKVVSDTEVGVVARGFNTAMEKLAAKQAEVERARQDLEAEIAERRRAEAELQEANRAILKANDNLRRFAYAASHDLQEPLRAVANYSELLRRRYGGRLDQDAHDFIEYIHSGAVRMQNLIKALLDYSRAGGRSEEPPQPVDCNVALQEALENLELAIEDTNACIEAEPLPHVLAHEVAVVQLFQNLIGNAIKYAGPHPPVVRVSAEADGNRWVLSVSDKGMGVARADHERIFGIFKRAHGPEYPGTGVGLAICSKIVDGYGGRIWVESEKGEGATFRFTLPRAQKTPSPAASSFSTGHVQARVS